MKKILVMLCSAVLLCASIFGFAACNSGKGDPSMDCIPPRTPRDVRILVPDGTPALALAQALTEGVAIQDYKTQIDFAAADVIAAKLTKSEIDLAILPTVSGATLYNKGAKIKLVSTNVFGNLYVIGVNGEVNSLEALKGKVVYVTTGTTIQMLKAVLAANDIEAVEGSSAEEGKVAYRSFSAASDVMPLMIQAQKNGTEAYGVFGEPQVTQLKGKVQTARTVVDLQTEWKKMTTFDGYPQASLFATDRFISECEEYIRKFCEILQTNAQWLKTQEHIDAFQQALQSTESTLKTLTLTEQTILGCNLGYQKAQEVKYSVMEYLSQLKQTVPAQEFFYAA